MMSSDIVSKLDKTWLDESLFVGLVTSEFKWQFHCPTLKKSLKLILSRKSAKWDWYPRWTSLLTTVNKKKRSITWCNRSNTRKSVSSDFPTPRSRLEKRGAAEFFLTNFEVFGNTRKHSFPVFDIASQTIDNSWRNLKQKFTKFYDN